MCTSVFTWLSVSTHITREGKCTLRCEGSTELTGLGGDEALTTPIQCGCLMGALSPGMPRRPGWTHSALSRGSREDCVPPAVAPTPKTGAALLQLRALLAHGPRSDRPFRLTLGPGALRPEGHSAEAGAVCRGPVPACPVVLGCLQGGSAGTSGVLSSAVPLPQQ